MMWSAPVSKRYLSLSLSLCVCVCLYCTQSFSCTLTFVSYLHQELSKQHRTLYEQLLSLTSVTNNFSALIRAIKSAPQPKIVPTCMFVCGCFDAPTTLMGWIATALILKELTRAHEVYATFHDNNNNFDVYKMRLISRIMRQFNVCSEKQYDYAKIYCIWDYLMDLSVLSADDMRMKSDDVWPHS
jgi:hypothetical protein